MKCIDCTREARPNRSKCVSCAEHANARMRKIHVKRRAAGLCSCGRASREGRMTCTVCAGRGAGQGNQTQRRRRQAGLCVRCKQPAGKSLCEGCTKEEAEYRRNLRHEVLMAYGGRCACCGEKNEKFLTLDHVNNDGAEQRRKRGYRGGSQLMLALRRQNYPADIQVLCWNCNSGRGYNGGICPHKE